MGIPNQPRENSDVQEYLRRRGLTIDPAIDYAWPDRNDTKKIIKVGDAMPEGTVIGFCRYGNGGALAILHDESKEGMEAVKTIVCPLSPR